MNTDILTAILVPLLFGALLAWLFMRQKVAAAQELGRTELAAELAVLQETLNQQTRETGRATGEVVSLKTTRDELQRQLDSVRQDRAQLQVHAERVKPLMEELELVRQESRRLNDDLLRLNNTDGQKSRQIEYLAARLKTADEDGFRYRPHAALASHARMDVLVCAQQHQAALAMHVRPVLPDERFSS